VVLERARHAVPIEIQKRLQRRPPKGGRYEFKIKATSKPGGLKTAATDSKAAAILFFAVGADAE
jgi:hypothetical protein